MKEDPSPEQSLQEWSGLFSDPASSLTAFGGEGNLSGSTYPASFYLALWLELFLVAGENQAKEKWASLSFQEQIDLGIRLLKCYLFHPLYIRLGREEKISVIKAPLRLESQGKLFRVEYGTGTSRKLELLYPLDHLRFWPELFKVFPENFFHSEKILKALEPGIILVSSSRLEKTRRRAETLAALFSIEKDKEIPEALPSGDQSKQPPVGVDIPEQGDQEVPAPDKPESEQPAPLVSELTPSPGLPPKRKKKKKTSLDQLELF
ncbi:MAG: hypothetical protein HY787_07905 [Deltaproteobacteria bacterium]|nr:hypothetical protein [Deltaproteobacteria bacterium]